MLDPAGQPRLMDFGIADAATRPDDIERVTEGTIVCGMDLHRCGVPNHLGIGTRCAHSSSTPNGDWNHAGHGVK